VIREAIRQLEVPGLVASRHGRGNYVREPYERDLNEVLPWSELLILITTLTFATLPVPTRMGVTARLRSSVKM
jgi:DNA-binding FadR family transcriptional regulator